MSSLLAGAIGGAVVIGGCVRAREKLDRFSGSLRPAVVRAVRGGMAIKKYLGEELKAIAEEAAQKERSVEVVYLKEKQPAVKKNGTAVKEQLGADPGTVREELDDIMEKAREADQEEEGGEAVPRKKEQLRSQIMSDIETLKEELDGIMDVVRDADQKEEKVEAVRPTGVDDRLERVERHLKTLDKKTKQKSIKRKPSKKSGAAR